MRDHHGTSFTQKFHRTWNCKQKGTRDWKRVKKLNVTRKKKERRENKRGYWPWDSRPVVIKTKFQRSLQPIVASVVLQVLLIFKMKTSRNLLSHKYFGETSTNNWQHKHLAWWHGSYLAKQYRKCNDCLEKKCTKRESAHTWLYGEPVHKITQKQRHASKRVTRKGNLIHGISETWESRGDHQQRMLNTCRWICQECPVPRVVKKKCKYDINMQPCSPIKCDTSLLQLTEFLIRFPLFWSHMLWTVLGHVHSSNVSVIRWQRDRGLGNLKATLRALTARMHVPAKNEDKANQRQHEKLYGDKQHGINKMHGIITGI